MKKLPIQQQIKASLSLLLAVGVFAAAVAGGLGAPPQIPAAEMVSSSVLLPPVSSGPEAVSSAPVSSKPRMESKIESTPSSQPEESAAPPSEAPSEAPASSEEPVVEPPETEPQPSTTPNPHTAGTTTPSGGGTSVQVTTDDGRTVVTGGLEVPEPEAIPDDEPPPAEPVITDPSQPLKLDYAGRLYPTEQFYYRNLLPYSLKAAYDEIYNAAVGAQEMLALSTSVSVSDIETVFFSVYYDNPELFWLNNGFKYSYYGSRVSKLYFSLNEAASDLDTYKSLFEKQANAILTQAATLRNDADKAKFIHDYLVDTVDYSDDAPMNQSPFSALISRKTVCAGYARAYQYLMQQLGIPCAVVEGVAAGQPHAWNIVKLGGGYYNTDLTWDDPLNNPEGRRYHDFFNVTDAFMSANAHVRSMLSVNLPACNAATYSYQNYYAKAS